MINSFSNIFIFLSQVKQLLLNDKKKFGIEHENEILYQIIVDLDKIKRRMILLILYIYYYFNILLFQLIVYLFFMKYS